MDKIEEFKNQWLDILSRNWWVLFLRGVTSLVFGLMLWVLPVDVSIETLILVVAIYVFVDGILQISTAITERKQRKDWLILFLWGVVSIVASVVIFLAPGLTILALLFYIGIWAIVKGFFEIYAAIRLRKEMLGEWFLIASGIISILFGGFLIVKPAAVAAAMIWVLATYAFILGVLFVGLSIKLKCMKGKDAKQ